MYISISFSVWSGIVNRKRRDIVKSTGIWMDDNPQGAKKSDLKVI